MKAAPRCSKAALISGTSCALSPEKLRATNDAPSCIASATRSIGSSVVVDALLALRAAVGGRRELALGQAVDAVVLDDIDHVDAAPHRMGELAEADRGGVAVARDAEIDEVAIGEIGAGQHRGHAPMHRIEAVALAEHVGRRLRRAADAAELGDAMRRQRQLETGADDRRADRIVAAAGAERRNRALVVAMGEAERVDLERRDAGISAWRDSSRDGLDVLLRRRLRQPGGDFADDEAGGDRRPAVMEDRRQPRRIDAEIGRSAACASARRGSARRRKPVRARAMKSATSGLERKGAQAQRVDIETLSAARRSTASSIAAAVEP